MIDLSSMITMNRAAEALGLDLHTVRAYVHRLGLGARVGGRRLLSPDDMAQLAARDTRRGRRWPEVAGEHPYRCATCGTTLDLFAKENGEVICRICAVAAGLM